MLQKTTMKYTNTCWKKGINYYRKFKLFAFCFSRVKSMLFLRVALYRTCRLQVKWTETCFKSDKNNKEAM